MRRFPAYDPPEYVNWKPDPEVIQEFRDTLAADPERQAIISELDRERLLAFYRGLLRNRLHDIQLKRWVMQGVLSKAWLGTGEEAVTIGCVHALRAGDVVGPMIRNAGAGHEMGVPLADLFRIYLGTGDTVLRGRDIHLGDLRHGVVAPISMVGSLVPVLAGFALAMRQRGEPRVALTWVGDGAVRTGEFHEGASFAAAQRLPLILVLQNNQVALGTPYDVHSRVSLCELAGAYGGPCLTAEGNNVLDVYAAASLLVRACRDGGGPAFLVAETGRMGGHATHDEAKGRQILPPEHFAAWGRRDPIGLLETYLEERLTEGGGGGTGRAVLEAVEAEVTEEIEAAAAAALASQANLPPDPKRVLDGVYAVDATAGSRLASAQGPGSGGAA
jgi:TPP-dependent pyruvate/acetoin dehydrogenase alpha subunit